MAYLILRNEQDAEETLADTLITAWRKIDGLRDATRLRPWLLTTATRLALRRRRPFRPRVVSLDLAADVHSGDRPSVDRVVLREAIDGLPPRMRAALALHDVADLPTSEVAAILGRSENTVKSQLREARARLRRALVEDEPSGDREAIDRGPG